jgi:hypothetical protein
VKHRRVTDRLKRKAFTATAEKQHVARRKDAHTKVALAAVMWRDTHWGEGHVPHLGESFGRNRGNWSEQIVISTGRSVALVELQDAPESSC